MALKLALMEKEDLDDFVEVDDAATQGWPYAKAMASGLPSHIPRKELIRGEMRKHFVQDEKTAWLKVVDVETGHLVAGALWRFQLEPEHDAAATVETDQGAAEESFMARQQRTWKEFLQRHVGARPYAHLAVLMTDPKHQRRGAGSMLVQWGCDRADERGILSTLHASPPGLRMYQAHGFEIVEQETLDLRPWGVDETAVRPGLIRPARSS